jgi:hypothetical protein
MSKAVELVELIKSALADDANDLTKQRARKACDQLLAVLRVEPGQPLPIPPVPTPTAQASSAPPSSTPATQLLDAVIAKLQAHLPKEPKVSEGTTVELRIPFVPLPSRGNG